MAFFIMSMVYSIIIHLYMLRHTPVLESTTASSAALDGGTNDMFAVVGGAGAVLEATGGVLKANGSDAG